MEFEDLLSRSLLVVTGKGGVGKTTVSLALARAASEAGKRAIVVETHAEEQIAHLLKRQPIEYQETELLPRLWGISISARRAFKEYLLQQIRIQSLYRAIFEHQIVNNFIEGTPGLADLMMIGKVFALHEKYDLTIVDAPSTGHGVALLEIASIVSGAVRLGPLGGNARKIDSLLRDRDKTAVCGVTLAEELPVSETIDLTLLLKNRVKIPLTHLFVNQVHTTPFSGEEKEEVDRLLPQLLTVHSALAEESGRSIKKLKEEIPQMEPLLLPFLYTTEFGLAEIEEIARTISCH